MQITTISYRRVHNLGQYETHSLEATATLAEGEDTDHAYATLVSYVDDMLDDGRTYRRQSPRPTYREAGQ